MFFQSLADFKSALLAYAAADGQGVSRPVDYVIKSDQTNYEKIRVYVAHSEPYGAVTPLNLLWLVSAPATPNSGKLLRRTLRTPNNGYQHTWEEVTTLEGAFTAQVWDTTQPTNLEERDHTHSVGNVHHMTANDVGALPASGGTMTGALNLRTPTSPDTYAPSEAVPRSFISTMIEAVVLPVRLLAQGTKSFQTNLNNQFINLRNRVIVLEQRQGAVRVLVHPVDSPGTPSVEVTHNFNRANVLVEVFNIDNEKVMPATIKPISPNVVQVHFADNFIGRIEVSPKAVF